MTFTDTTIRSLLIIAALIFILAWASGCASLDANGNPLEPVNYTCPIGFHKMPTMAPPVQPICIEDALRGSV
jgi:hypothetical protein